MIQYFHHNPERKSKVDEQLRYTVAVEIPSKLALLQLIMPMNKRDLDVNIGIARCNPLDQYNRKVGRELSESRLSIFPFKLDTVKYEDDTTFYYFFTEDKTAGLLFKTHPKNEHVYFAEALLSL